MLRQLLDGRSRLARAGSAEGRPRRFSSAGTVTSCILILPQERQTVNTKIAECFQITNTGKMLLAVTETDPLSRAPAAVSEKNARRGDNFFVPRAPGGRPQAHSRRPGRCSESAASRSPPGIPGGFGDVLP